ncbi:MAG: NADH-quinone oxidoreductase subunit L [Actinomycetota bacterium]|nr:NADH-quinone oxidoreductase subunit L [Actinomycetota bacterium]
MIAAAWICLLTPLGAALAIALAGNRITRRGAGYLATGSVAASFVAAVVAFALLLGNAPEHRWHPSTLWSWLTAGQLDFGLRILVDPLSVFMMLVVSGVGSLIVAYSIGYMDGDEEERRYFAYMALFVFSMLLLVQGGNLLLLLVGWGLVGLSSYLLIGFWHDRPSAVAAAKKAFVMNAIGDATMALALFVLIQRTGSLDFEAVFTRTGSLGGGWAVNLIALGLLGGAVAKSAQLPLQTWLPDAMEGPTPVSALIHAATMVTAGVYLIARTHPLFEAAPRVLELAAGLGAATLVLAGLIALVQTDIKRVIAYSTMSQIGYMFLAVGLGAYANGMFHLMTHAFFKALLFMAAGIVIHALAGEQDIRKMGGLRRLMPFTYVAFLVGALSLAGVPPFSGFFSKDSILAAALAHGWYGEVLWVAGMLGTFLTGLYTFRLFFVVFWGEPSAFVSEHLMTGSHAHAREGHLSHDDHDEHMHAGEGPFSMTLTVGVLTVLAAIGGFIQFAGVWTPVSDWLAPVAAPLVEATGTQEAVSSVLAVVLGLAGIWVAWLVYGARQPTAPMFTSRAATLARSAFEHKFYFDELYDLLFYRPGVLLARGLYRLVEQPLVLGSVRELVRAVRELGFGTGRLQTGLVRTYALSIAASVAIVTVVFVAVR